jgi:hypothetical protein
MFQIFNFPDPVNSTGSDSTHVLHHVFHGKESEPVAYENFLICNFPNSERFSIFKLFRSSVRTVTTSLELAIVLAVLAGALTTSTAAAYASNSSNLGDTAAVTIPTAESSTY